ncbi:molybdopterin-guanine dinucleotide biosynthesis protein B [Fulvimarina pelagi HTCC2506]|uniref:Molybdopterin-guanine dinucleotide biosynthesis protein B n=1 Tax=Fulvimarina pelagi HTCC2506 TaxID=314231 RepID=Q0G136_9HYPH|nr:molybdopterin-guanine dinucleotide biosynthesis protein B [Fulvimarina pelagi]EAU40803.1 molybdopterin-guanine dinucleotide biosynthesis protein B [Fulvimarina pelagi HTCC2506]
MAPIVFGITGWKNSGKTTLTERLIAELTARGHRVASIKHAHHAFDVDQEGTDSYRHRAAGAAEVAIVSSVRWALMHELKGADEPTLEEMLTHLSSSDFVIVEGFKQSTHEKIECRRKDAVDHTPLAGRVPGIVAVASDNKVDNEMLPVFDLDDVAGIADFVESRPQTE